MDKTGPAGHRGDDFFTIAALQQGDG